MRSEDVPVLKSDLFLAAIMFGTGLVSDGAEAVRTVPEYRLRKDEVPEKTVETEQAL